MVRVEVVTVWVVMGGEVLVEHGKQRNPLYFMRGGGASVLILERSCHSSRRLELGNEDARQLMLL